MKRLLCSILVCAAVCVVSGCNGDESMPDDVTKVQDKARLQQGVRPATDLPPGLGPDRAAPATLPAKAN